jgi:hypothetical protein
MPTDQGKMPMTARHMSSSLCCIIIVMPIHQGAGPTGKWLFLKDSAARYIGSQPQAQLQWNIDRHITFIAIYAHFFTGEFLRETGPQEDRLLYPSWDWKTRPGE